MKMTKWRWIFLGVTLLVVYFAFGIAQKGQNTGFFVGLVSGSIICYFFLRAKDEAVANANMNTNQQTVNLQLNQQRIHGFTEEQMLYIQELVESRQGNKQLLAENNYGLPESRTDVLADYLRERRNRNV